MRAIVLGGLIVLLFSAGTAIAQESTWEVIQNHILSGNCTSCHRSGTSFARQSGLVLTEDLAYDQLVDVSPTNLAARSDGLLRVSSVGGLPGLSQSFLWEKINVAEQEHFYDDHPNYGALMPLGQPSLTNGQLAFMKNWILGGAPRTGIVADRALLEDTSRYEPPAFRALDPPEQGIQLHLGPFDVWPSEKYDREFLYFEPYKTEEDLFVSRYEISYRPGSHHFILYNYPEEERVPPERTFRDIRDAQGRLNLGTALEIGRLFPFSFFVGSQVPYMNYHFPPGVALRLPAGSGFDMNSHSVNRSGETQVGEVYVNLHTKDKSEVLHIADYGNFGNFDISLPPNQVTTLSKTFTFEETQHVLQMWSHAHEHMTEFRVERVGGESDGELLYWSNDWEHPPVLELDPPLTFQQGDQIRLVTTYNNTTDSTIKYGLLSSDEMQFLFYIYFTGDLVPGDYNGNGNLDAADIDLLSVEVREGHHPRAFDLNRDGFVNQEDRRAWVETHKRTYFGDSDLDGQFATSDLVAVFQAGQYEDALTGNSSWATGDWDGDGDFGTGDLVLAFQSGGFEQGPRPAAEEVPEPSSALVLVCSAGLLLGVRGRRP
jgi:hypothetical protein